MGRGYGPEQTEVVNQVYVTRRTARINEAFQQLRQRGW
jgi:hypothetical protein